MDEVTRDLLREVDRINNKLGYEKEDDFDMYREFFLNVKESLRLAGYEID